MTCSREEASDTNVWVFGTQLNNIMTVVLFSSEEFKDEPYLYNIANILGTGAIATPTHVITSYTLSSVYCSITILVISTKVISYSFLPGSGHLYHLPFTV